jgi:P-type Cu2+ transporter
LSTAARRAKRQSPPSIPATSSWCARGAVGGTIEEGRSEVDQSLVTGETLPIAVSAGAPVYAGTLNLAGALRARVAKEAGDALLDEVNALFAKATEQRSSYVRLADRAARLYAPFVHIAALAGFLGWL